MVPVTVRGVSIIQFVPELTYAAIGALAGVLIQQIIQVWNSYLGRHSDRVLKTYETKLEVFTEFLFTIDEVSKIAGYVKKLETDSNLQAFLAAKAKMDEAHAIADSLERELNSEPPPSADVAAALRARASDEAQRIDDARALSAKMVSRAEQLSHDLKAKRELLETTRTNLSRLGFKLSLISNDGQMAASISQIGQKIKSGEMIEPNDYAAFIKIAAKSVGIR
jgi:hypothetical protein